jgi:small subunit ribosomal protein S3
LGQKVNPIGLRLGVTRTWESVWYSHKNYSKWLHEDLKVRKAIKKEFYPAGIAKIDIERSGEKLKIIIHTAKPGIVVGRKGVGIERRYHFRRPMKTAISQAMKSGAEGIKIQTSGRLGGAEIARTERYQEGRTPLHTLRANIDYGYAIAKTTYGVIGVRVWMSKGDSIDKKPENKRKQKKN